MCLPTYTYIIGSENSVEPLSKDTTAPQHHVEVEFPAYVRLHYGEQLRFLASSTSNFQGHGGPLCVGTQYKEFGGTAWFCTSTLVVEAPKHAFVFYLDRG